jgi:hypothetical protein
VKKSSRKATPSKQQAYKVVVSVEVVADKDDNAHKFARATADDAHTIVKFLRAYLGDLVEDYDVRSFGLMKGDVPLSVPLQIAGNELKSSRFSG